MTCFYFKRSSGPLVEKGWLGRTMEAGVTPAGRLEFRQKMTMLWNGGGRRSGQK